jgi:hypothetical protein
MNVRLDGPQRRSEGFGKEKNIAMLPEIKL